MLVPWWVLGLAVAGVCSWISATILARNNPDTQLGWFRSPPIAPLSQLAFLGASVATAWLAGSYAAETPLGGWGFPLAGLAVFVPWALVRRAHNRQVG